MHENFDCTQFLTFNTIIDYDVIVDKIKLIFTSLNLNIIEVDSISNVEKIYFSEFWDCYFFELENSTFLGEFTDWLEKDNPPQNVKIFVNALYDIMEILQLDTMKVIMCSFADMGKTENVTKK